MRRLAIIPARGGSKRIVGKNIRDFCGKPMIAHVLDAADKSSLFDIIHVSTDCPEITKSVTQLGYKPDFPRPVKLADDYTPIMPVLKYVAEAYFDKGKEFDQIWLLMACSPLIDAQDLIGAAKLVEKKANKKAVISIASYPAPVEWAFDLKEDGALVPIQSGKFAIRSQDLGEKYYDTGSFVGFPASQVLESTGAGTDTGYVGFELPRHKAIDIDTESDWTFAETIYKSNKQSFLANEQIRDLRIIKDSITLKIDKECYIRPLREYEITDAYINGLNDPEVKKFLVTPNVRYQDEHSIRAFVRDNDHSTNAILFALYYHNNHVGNIRIHDICWEQKDAWLGIALFDRFSWGQGLGTKALKLVVSVGFNMLGLSRIHADIESENFASQRIFQKIGFTVDEANERKWSISFAEKQISEHCD